MFLFLFSFYISFCKKREETEIKITKDSSEDCEVSTVL